MNGWPFSWHLSGLRFLLGVLLCGTVLGTLTLADPPRPRAEEEEEKPAKKVPKKPGDKRDEEEEKGNRPLRPPPRVEEEEEKTPATPAFMEADLAKAAQEARHVAVKALFAELAIPHDLVKLKGNTRITSDGAATRGGEVWIEPLSFYTAAASDLTERITIQPLDRKGKKLKAESPAPGVIEAIRYYEKIAVVEVKEFLDQHFERFDSSNVRFLSRMEQLRVADQALSAVARFHESARTRGVRKGDGWKPLETELRGSLLATLVEQMQEFGEARQWDRAFVLMKRLAETYSTAEDQAKITGPLTKFIEKALTEDAFTSKEQLQERRDRLRDLAEQFIGNEAIQPVAKTLRARASALFEEAKKLAKADRKTEALNALRLAEDTWPQLAGLRTFRLELDGAHQVLRVGVRELPRYLSPARATTDTELRCVEMLFESLVKLSPDTSGMMFYQPGLAEGRPKVVSLGREFRLPRTAEWSDGAPVTLGDLRETVRLLKEGKGTGKSAAWGQLVERVQVQGDPYRMNLRMYQGFLDPLALASFKVLPNRASPAPDSEAFAIKPIGSGPFRYLGIRSLAGREVAQFEANPSFGSRPSKSGLPRLREVHLSVLPDLVRGLEQGQIDLALDLTAEQAVALQKPGMLVPLPAHADPSTRNPTLNRRIYFLAVNHRKSTLANKEIRQGLARAIHREKLLDEHFRGPLERKVHRAINGPYPAGAWACDPKLTSRSDKNSLDLFDLELARVKFKQGLAKTSSKEVRLTLKYPSGDKRLLPALKELVKQVAQLPGLSIDLVERSPWELREDVEKTHDYDLAYYYHDFADETFWLLPLLGSHGRDGAGNFLGYVGEPMMKNIQSAMSLRNFAEVRNYARIVHLDFVENEMTFIPLWQLDPLYAYRKNDLDLPPLDPQWMFTDVERWQLRRK